MIFLKTKYGNFLDRDDLESYDNKALGVFIAYGIIAQTTLAFEKGEFLDATELQIFLSMFKIIFVGLIAPFLFYYINGALTHFFSSKLGGTASRAELRIAYVIGSSPVMLLNISITAMYIVLSLIGCSPHNIGMTYANPGASLQFIKHISTIFSIIAAIFTSIITAKLSKFSIIKGFISCYWFLIIGFPFWLYLYFKIKM